VENKRVGGEREGENRKEVKGRGEKGIGRTESEGTPQVGLHSMFEILKNTLIGSMR